MAETNSSPPFGVYCLANDGALEWFEMFVRSLRLFNPDLPLSVIPYDTNIARLRELTGQFHFDILPEEQVARFDALEEMIMKNGHHAPMFRKWACFFGRYEHFLFFDADIAVTMSLGKILEALQASRYDFIYFDTDITMVYAPAHIADMQAKFGAPGFNAGAFASRRSAMTEALLWQTAEAAVRDRHLLKDQVDQPFLNYVFDTLPRSTAHVNTLLPELSHKPWARTDFRYDFQNHQATDHEGQQMPFIHWAGCHFPTMVRPAVFLENRLLGLSFTAQLKYRLGFYYLRGRRFLSSALRRSLRL